MQRCPSAGRGGIADGPHNLFQVGVGRLHRAEDAHEVARSLLGFGGAKTGECWVGTGHIGRRLFCVVPDLIQGT